MPRVMDLADLSPGFFPEEPTFHRFNDLPAELRIKIWKLAMIPRIVLIQQKALRDRGRYKYRESENEADNSMYNLAIGRRDIVDTDRFNVIRTPKNSHWRETAHFVAQGICPGVANPGSISACYESYDVMRKHYVLAFSSRFMGITESVPQTWFNVKEDTFYFRWNTFGYPCYSFPGNHISSYTYGCLAIRDYHNLHNIENLAVIADPSDSAQTMNQLMQMFRVEFCGVTFPSVKRITFIVTNRGSLLWTIVFVHVRPSTTEPGAKRWAASKLYDVYPNGAVHQRPCPPAWEEARPGRDNWEGMITKDIIEFWKAEIALVHAERYKKGGDLYTKPPSKIQIKIKKGKELVERVVTEFKIRFRRI